MRQSLRDRRLAAGIPYQSSVDVLEAAAAAVGIPYQSSVDVLEAAAAAVGIPYQSSVDVEASKRRARNIDRVSRRTFPLAFVVFNIVYWVTYSVPSATYSADDYDEL